MLTGFFNITIVAELLTFLAALLLLHQFTKPWSYFRIMLFLTLATELTGWYMTWKLGMRNNAWMYNLLLCVRGCFTLWMLSTSGYWKKGDLHKIRLACYMLVGLTILSVTYNKGWHSYNILIDILLGFTLAIFCCRLLYNILNEGVYRSLLSNEHFWLANGVLIYSLGNAVLSVSMPELGQYQMASGIRLWKHLNDTLNVFLHASYIIAFVCRYRNTRSLLLSS